LFYLSFFDKRHFCLFKIAIEGVSFKSYKFKNANFKAG
jgi:hypothetical protein